MIEASTISAFLGGLGAGSVVTALLQHFLARRAQLEDVLRKDRSEVYSGLLQALESLEVTNSIENAKRFGMWAARAEVIGSDDVIDAIAKMRVTPPNSTERSAALALLLKRMRSDLNPS
ncbi:hypothetical protein MBSD_n2424 [Mizugakiibacter sediminis]|uniref:Uncharacterized protein n=1 Tax=Mizugakiibacter sediminis TaxID=1475481 RepID=A0A0K8QQE9_9GAMM|nr:hypothetical protein [Mizugakiibacter sediminis]GAP67108.1 hypothetical protein MBSD_n2424 [Mizugakiibacter sediminis]